MSFRPDLNRCVWIEVVDQLVEIAPLPESAEAASVNSTLLNGSGSSRAAHAARRVRVNKIDWVFHEVRIEGRIASNKLDPTLTLAKRCDRAPE